MNERSLLGDAGRLPRQKRSQARVDRILDEAAKLLSEDEAELTARALADRADVSIGTIYQFFTDLDAVRLVATTRVEEALASALAKQEAENLAARPHEFFQTLIFIIVQVQRAYPEIGCLARRTQRTLFTQHLANVLQARIADHVAAAFGKAFPRSDRQRIDRLLLLVDGALVGSLARLPTDADERETHIAMTCQMLGDFVTAQLKSP